MNLFMLSCICFACVCMLQQAIVPKPVLIMIKKKYNSAFDCSAEKVREMFGRIRNGQLAQRI